MGLSGYKTIACHHNPEKTAEVPHVMQPEGSRMHESIERINRLIEGHCRVMVLEASMNNATYPFYFDYLGKPAERCNFVEKISKAVTPYSMAITPEPVRRTIMRNIRSVYEPFEIHAGRVEDVVEAVRFLATSRYITGDVIFVDGGQHLKGRADV